MTTTNYYTPKTPKKLIFVDMNDYFEEIDTFSSDDDEGEETLMKMTGIFDASKRTNDYLGLLMSTSVCILPDNELYKELQIPTKPLMNHPKSSQLVNYINNNDLTSIIFLHFCKRWTVK